MNKIKQIDKNYKKILKKYNEYVKKMETSHERTNRSVQGLFRL